MFGSRSRVKLVITMEEIKWKTTQKRKPPPKSRKVEVKDIKYLMLPDTCRRRTARKEGVKWRSRVTGVLK